VVAERGDAERDGDEGHHIGVRADEPERRVAQQRGVEQEAGERVEGEQEACGSAPPWAATTEPSPHSTDEPSAAATASGEPPIAAPGALSTTTVMPAKPSRSRITVARSMAMPATRAKTAAQSTLLAVRIAVRLALRSVRATVAMPWPPSRNRPVNAARRSCGPVAPRRPPASMPTIPAPARKTTAAPASGGIVSTITFMAGTDAPQHR
jgi:hypothetical protein